MMIEIERREADKGNMKHTQHKTISLSLLTVATSFTKNEDNKIDPYFDSSVSIIIIHTQP